MGTLVSIIIPAYNASNFLRETLDSVLQQKYSHWEAIVVNDGSKDDTLQIARKFAAEDARFQVIDQANAGVSVARNNGFQQSKGEYLAFLDADDLWHPDFLQARVEVLDTQPSVGLVNGAVATIGPDSKPLPDQYQGHGDHVVRDILEFAPKVTIPSNLLCRKSVYHSIGGFHPLLSNVADKMLFIEFGRSSKVVCLQQTHLYYRLHPNSMHRNLDLMEADYLRFLNVLTEKGLFEQHSRAKFKARIFKICAGAFREHGKTGPFLRYLVLSVWSSPLFWFRFVTGGKP
ncbi:MAG: glycosyltransferase family 2 protein [Salibacteraceae bacterium]|mgnify:CR=1 FL=1